MFATAARIKRDLGVLSVSLNAPTGHRSLPRRIAAGPQDQTAAGAGAGYGCLSGGCSITPSGDWDSGNPTFALSRGSPSAPPLASGHGHWFSAMLFSLTVLSDSGKASDPEISPLISARCAGDTAVRLMAHRGSNRASHSGSSAFRTRAWWQRSASAGIPSGRRFPLAFGTYTRRTGSGSQVRMVSCTRTAISALARDVRATSPSIPAVLRPAFRCVTCRTLIRVFDQERSIIFCKDRTFGQSCSRDALKILCRSRLTLPSWTRQSTASQSGMPSGPFACRAPPPWPPPGRPCPRRGRPGPRPGRPTPGWRSCIPSLRLTCPSVRTASSASKFKGSPATRQPRFRASHQGWYPAGYARAPGGGAGDRSPGFPAAFRLPAFASWASCSRQRDSALLTVGLPGSAWTLAGFPRCAHLSHDRIGCPLYPEAQRCSHGRSDPSGRRLPPLPGARPYHPGVHSIFRSCLLRGVIEGSLAFTRPVFPPRLLTLDGTGPLGLAPRASHPGRQDLHGARQGRGRASSTRPELYARHQHRTSFR